MNTLRNRIEGFSGLLPPPGFFPPFSPLQPRQLQFGEGSSGGIGQLPPPPSGPPPAGQQQIVLAGVQREVVELEDLTPEQPRVDPSQQYNYSSPLGWLGGPPNPQPSWQPVSGATVTSHTASPRVSTYAGGSTGMQIGSGSGSSARSGGLTSSGLQAGSVISQGAQTGANTGLEGAQAAGSYAEYASRMAQYWLNLANAHQTPIQPVVQPQAQNAGYNQTVAQGGNNVLNANNNNNVIPNVANNAGDELKNQLEELKKVVLAIPGVKPPYPKASPTCHEESRFVPAIAQVAIPKRFVVPHMRPYDGKTDPEEHVHLYKEKMEVMQLPPRDKEALMCKGFGQNLTGAAMMWWKNIPLNSISSYSQLVNMFLNQFAGSRTLDKRTTDLYRIVQGAGESLKDYLTRFNMEVLTVPRLEPATAMEAFRMGLKQSHPFYNDLTQNPPNTLDEIRDRAMQHIRVEEDKKVQETFYKKAVGTSDPPTSRKIETSHSHHRSNRGKPYSRPETHKINSIDDDNEPDEEFPAISDYCFAVDIAGVMNKLHDLGDKTRWPRKSDRPNVWKDKSKWCAYHEDFGHTTEECNALKREIAILLQKGLLKDLFHKPKQAGSKESGQADQQPEAARQTEETYLHIDPPPITRMVNFITGGSEMCGTTYSSAKRNAKESKLDRPVRLGRNPVKVSP